MLLHIGRCYHTPGNAIIHRAMLLYNGNHIGHPNTHHDTASRWHKINPRPRSPVHGHPRESASTTRANCDAIIKRSTLFYKEQRYCTTGTTSGIHTTITTWQRAARRPFKTASTSLGTIYLEVRSARFFSSVLQGFIVNPCPRPPVHGHP